MNVLDEPPESEVLTAYDRAHVSLYVRLLDAAAEKADWREVASILFGLDVELDSSRARRVYDAHLARARWIAEQGYHDLLTQRS